MNKFLRIVACVLAVVTVVVIGYVVESEVGFGTNVEENQQQDQQRQELKKARQAYIENPDLFECSWSSEFDVPDWMTMET